MENEKMDRVCKFYALTHRLKNLLRAGWVQWEVKTERIESVAEHIYGTMMLAFAINSEFDLSLDLEKLMLMLAFHELGECIIGDITIMDGVPREEKQKREIEAVAEIVSGLKDATRIEEIFSEYTNVKSREARFAKMIDKLECEFQCKYYEEMGCNDISFSRVGVDEKIRQDGLKKGYKTLAEIWLNYDKERFDLDETFKNFIDYVLDNQIFTK